MEPIDTIDLVRSPFVLLSVLQHPVDSPPRNERAMTECSRCAHRREKSHTHHIQCAKPDARMQGSRHGIERGWFMYPLEFDPIWKAKRCSNFKPVDESAVSDAVSDAVSLDQ